MCAQKKDEEKKKKETQHAQNGEVILRSSSPLITGATLFRKTRSSIASRVNNTRLFCNDRRNIDKERDRLWSRGPRGRKKSGDSLWYSAFSNVTKHCDKYYVSVARTRAHVYTYSGTHVAIYIFTRTYTGVCRVYHSRRIESLLNKCSSWCWKYWKSWTIFVHESLVFVLLLKRFLAPLRNISFFFFFFIFFSLHCYCRYTLVQKRYVNKVTMYALFGSWTNSNGLLASEMPRTEDAHMYMLYAYFRFLTSHAHEPTNS